MKIQGQLLIISLTIAILTGCGEIEEAAASGSARAAVDTSVSDGFDSVNEKSSAEQQIDEDQQKNDTQEGNETQTVADPRQVARTQQVTETTVAATEVPDVITEPSEPVGSEEQSGDVITPENIESYQFGFELFNDGHKNCWDQRYECAKIMLEAVSQTNAAENTVDLTVNVEQLNTKESSGFMTWLKFEDNVSFKVGDTVMSGSTLNMIDYDGSYYFFIGEIEEMTGMIRFDSSYIPRILEAAGVGG